MLRHRCCSGGALIAAAAWSFNVQAAVVQLAPIPVEVEAPQTTSILSLTNRASSEVALQARVFRWTQENGEDKLTPTDDVVLSPPISLVPAGGTLGVRVVRVAKQPLAAEETYRIWVDELPSNKADARPGGSLRILMRYSVPVFFVPSKGGDEPKLAWRLSRSKDGAWSIAASNPGPRRVQFYDLGVGANDSGADQNLSGYVLAGQRMKWKLPMPPKSANAPGTVYQLRYRTDAGIHREDLSPRTAE